MGFGAMLGAVIQADRFERDNASRIVAVPSVEGSVDRDRIDHAA
jgi:hypothetical protein